MHMCVCIYIYIYTYICINMRTFTYTYIYIYMQTHTHIYVNSTILFGCETWVPYRWHVRPLVSFHITRLQLILELRWWHNVTHSEIKSMNGVRIISVIASANRCVLPVALWITDYRLPS